MKRHILMNPGPVMTSDFVKQAMIHADICHRDEQFSELLKSVQEKLLKVFRADKTYSTVVITGSGTAVMEAAISSAITQDEKVLIITNGAFGERFIEIAELHKLNVVPLKYKERQYL